MDLSLIIPVYNVAPYLGTCLESIYDGSVDEDSFEVIIVNDGSTDGSATVIDGFAARHGNIQVITQENQGLSMARMNGLARAQGTYVWFVDSDDYLADHALAGILQLIQESSETPVIMTPIRWMNGDEGKSFCDYEINHPLLMTGQDVLFDPRFPQWLCCRYIIRKSLFDNRSLFFPKGLLHEDEYFGSVLLMMAEKVLVHDKVFFNHRVRSGSIMQTLSIQSSYDSVSNYELLKEFAKTLPESSHNDFLRHAQRLLRLSYVSNEKKWKTHEFHQFKREKGPYILSEFLRNAHSYSFRELASLLLLTVDPNTFRRLFPAQ